MKNICLSLMTGVDIPIPECQIIIHQPTIKEISLLGEKAFFAGAQTLCVNKNMYQGEGKEQLENISNFQLFISLINEPKIAEQKLYVQQVLSLLMPDYKIIFTPRAIMLNLDTENFIIDESNFDAFQDICKQVFCLNRNGQEEYNPANKKAKEIADKIMRGRAKVAAMKAAEGQHSSALTQYISVLCVGLKYTVETVVNMTLFQLYDLIERNSMFLKWDTDIKSIMAGAKMEKGPDDWMKSIH